MLTLALSLPSILQPTQQGRCLAMSAEGLTVVADNCPELLELDLQGLTLTSFRSICKLVGGVGGLESRAYLL